MEIKLTKKPKNVIIIEGFPGLGLIGTITTEFLMDNLDFEKIGKIFLKEIPAMIAVHENKVIEPIGIFYNEKYNLVVIHGITNVSGYEWDIADAILKVAKELNAKKIISIEGVGSSKISEETNIYFYTNKENEEILKKAGAKLLGEGIIVGVTGALMVRAEEFPLVCVFAETYTNLPDSKAAASVISFLDNYLNLQISPKPLIEQAERFEKKLKGLLQKTKEAMQLKEKKELSYVG